MQIRNPRTGKLDYKISILPQQEIAAICQNLKQQQTAWANSSIQNRIEVLQQWKNAVQKNKQALVDALAIDTGRIQETILEVDLVASSIDRWCNIALDFFKEPTQKNSSIPFINLQQNVVPFGLVGVISPWNFPLLLSLIDTIPALLSGCAVIVKPSEVTPRFIKIIQQTIQEVKKLKNIFCYVEGNGSVGEALVNNCDIICFTGSTATGKKVYDAASKNMIPVFLELGGKDPALVFDGADLELATSSILWGSTVNAGQSCLSIERVYVQDTIYKEFVEKLIQKAQQLSLNSSCIKEGQIGPIIFEKQVQIINTQLQDALQKGATILYGNSECQFIKGGYYCLPTILTNVSHNMKLMQEETFGPIIPIMAFKNEQQAIELTNESIYGLSAAVFAKDEYTALNIGKQIIGGAVSINDCALTAIMHEGEKNSFKLSGIGGTRMGPNAIKRFMRQQVFIIKNKNIPSPWWFNV
jgi:aldehyde dehydrogenase (NAD+)